MRVQTRLFILLTAVVALTVVGIRSIDTTERQRLLTIANGMEQDRNVFFRQLIKLKGESLENFVHNYTYWDELIQFTKAPDPKWARDQLEASMPSFKLDGIWVYNLNKKLVYATVNRSSPSNPPALPLPDRDLVAFLQLLHRQRFAHFFVQTPQGLLEVRAATIHPSDDPEHRTAPQGYFLAGRLWSKQFLTHLGSMVHAQIELLPPDHQPLSKLSKLDVQQGILTNLSPLRGWDQQVVAQLSFKSASPLLGQLDAAYDDQLLQAVVVGGLMCLILLFALVVWVVLPLRSLSQALVVEDASLIHKLSTAKTEFGELAQLILKFFHQKELLLSEIAVRKSVETELRQSEERYVLAAAGANDGLWDWDLQQNQIYFSNRWKSMLGFAELEIPNQVEAWLERIHPEDREQMQHCLQEHLEGKSEHFEYEYRMRLKDGSYRWMLCRGLAVRDQVGQAYRIAGSQTDLTDRKALYDPLTHLANRSLLMERLRQAMQIRERYPARLFAVLFLDLDRFKWVNDSLGHWIGDRLLIEIAARLKALSRSEDTVARLGGDEFVLLLANLSTPAEAIAVASRIQHTLAQVFEIEGHTIYTGTSIGIAFADHLEQKGEELLQYADMAMYQSKSRGGNNVQVFDTAMRVGTSNRLKLELELRQALEQQQLLLYYQPIVCLSTGTLQGFEALVRWQHPQAGLLSPVDFLPLAEETGLILPIGTWILQTACSQMYSWQQQIQADVPLSISVNFSTRQFFHPNFLQQIQTILSETGLAPHCLKLELTEHTMIEDAERAARLLSQLNALGIDIQLDDFGTGFSSLSHLHEFPIHTLKIDRCFTQQALDSSRHKEIVQAVVTLAHNLGLSVVAEGIETKAQYEQLRNLGCDYGQGYFFTPPLDLFQATAWMTASGSP